MHFTITDEHMISSCREIFVSEAFPRAIRILTQAYSEMTQEQALDILMGKKTIKKGMLVDDHDEEYVSLINEILELNYDHIIDVNGKKLQIVGAIDFSDPACKFIADAPDCPQAEMFKKIFAPIDDKTALISIADLTAEDVDCLSVSDRNNVLENDSFLVLGNDTVYIFNKFPNTFFKEVCKQYDSHIQAIEKFDFMN